MKRTFSIVLCLLLISMRSVCACEMAQIPHSESHGQSQEHEGCHGHEEQSQEPTHHACLCIDHDDQGLISDSIQIHAPSSFIANLHWEVANVVLPQVSTELFIYFHSPPNQRPLYLTQASLLI